MEEKGYNTPGTVQYYLKNGLDAFGNQFILNLIFILFSIPVITIGASVTALYSVSMKLIRGEAPHLWSSFIQSFKANFLKATIVWIIILLVVGVIAADYMVVVTMTGAVTSVALFLGTVEFVALLLIVPFVFPLIARFDNSVANTFKNSLLLAVSHLGSWIKVTLLWVVPAYFTIAYPAIFMSIWYLWLLWLFGFMAYMSAKVMNKLFESVSEVKAEDNKKETKRQEEIREFFDVRNKALSFDNSEAEKETESDTEESEESEESEE